MEVLFSDLSQGAYRGTLKSPSGVHGAWTLAWTRAAMGAGHFGHGHKTLRHHKIGAEVSGHFGPEIEIGA